MGLIGAIKVESKKIIGSSISKNRNILSNSIFLNCNIYTTITFFNKRWFLIHTSGVTDFKSEEFIHLLQ